MTLMGAAGRYSVGQQRMFRCFGIRRLYGVEFIPDTRIRREGGTAGRTDICGGRVTTMADGSKNNKMGDKRTVLCTGTIFT